MTKLIAAIIGILVWLPISVFYLISWPFVFLYEQILCCLAWRKLKSDEQLIIVVHDGQKDSGGFLARILDSAGERVQMLDYAARQEWARWALPVRMFWRFGPIPLPPRFIPEYLPAVVLVGRLKRPLKFSFGSMSKEREASWDRFRRELQNRPNR